jgi:hypothetical protein
MPALEFVVSFKITIMQEDIDKVKSLVDAGFPSTACRVLMDKYNVHLVHANCIRKVIMQGTYDFVLDLDKPRADILSA